MSLAKLISNDNSIYIKQGPAMKLNTKESLFVSFNYDSDIVSKIKSLPTRYYNIENHSWEVPIKDINLLVNVLSNYEINITGKVNTKVKNVTSSIHHTDINPVDIVYNPITKPFKHQALSFEYSKQHSKFLLGDEQGLGKTKQSIDIAVAYKKYFKHCLIICCVNGVKWNWVNEIKTHSHENSHIIGTHFSIKGNKVIEGGNTERIADLKQPHDAYFMIINIEALRNTEIVDILSHMCADGTIGYVIVDEIHKCNNPQAQQTKGLFKIQTPYEIALTGTPLINKPLDLYVPLKWLNVENHSFYTFKNHYCVMGGFGGYEIVSYKNMKELQSTLNLCMLRRLKKDVLDLPEKVYSTEYVEMNDAQSAVYKDVLNSIKSDIMTIVTSPNPLAQLIRLRQVTGWTKLLSTVDANAKMDRLMDIVEEKIDNNKKVIIFSNWTDITHVMQEKLKKYNPAIVTGEVVGEDRMEEINKFQTDDNCKLIIGTIAAMGTGLTLTAAQTVIFYDEPWSRKIKDQAIDRAHRIGQTQTINVITLLTKNTIDERVHEIDEEKGEISDVLVDGKIPNNLNKEKLVNFLLS